MTDIDVRRVAPNATLNVWGMVSGAEHIVMGTGRLAPDEVNLTYLYDFARGEWRFYIAVSGARVLRDGRRGRSTTKVNFHDDDIAEAPQWVQDFVKQHVPPALPRMEEVG